MAPPLVLDVMLSLSLPLPGMAEALQLLRCGSGGGRSALQLQLQKPGERYRSPLLQFRAYRNNPLCWTASGVEPGGARMRNGIQPLWPLCPFDLRGQCSDTSCRLQHRQDARSAEEGREAASAGGEQSAGRGLGESGSPRPALRIPLPLSQLWNAEHAQAAPAPVQGAARVGGRKLRREDLAKMSRAQQERVRDKILAAKRAKQQVQAEPAPAPAPAKKRRVSAAQMQQIAQEGELPLYTRHAATASARLPADPIAPEQPALRTWLAGSSTADRGFKDALVPGHGAAWALLRYYFRPAAAAPTPADAAAAGTPAARDRGRYFRSAAAGADAGASPAPERDLRADAGSQEEWVWEALERLEQGQALFAPEQREAAIKVLVAAVGQLLQDKRPTWRIWPLYLHLLVLHRRHAANVAPASRWPTEIMAEVRNISRQVLAVSPSSYQLWRAVMDLEDTWQLRVDAALDGIVALAIAAPPAEQAAPGTGPGPKLQQQEAWLAMRAAAMLDLALQCLQLWIEASVADAAKEFVSRLAAEAATLGVPELEAAAGSHLKARGLTAAAAGQERLVHARAALLTVLSFRPREAAVLWLAATQVRVWGELPQQVACRLGYLQQPFVLTWQPLPSGAMVQEARALLGRAASASAGGLDLVGTAACAPADGRHAAVPEPELAAAKQALALSIVGLSVAGGGEAVLKADLKVPLQLLRHALVQEQLPASCSQCVLAASLAYLTAPRFRAAAAAGQGAAALWPDGDVKLLQWGIWTQPEAAPRTPPQSPSWALAVAAARARLQAGCERPPAAPAAAAGAPTPAGEEDGDEEEAGSSARSLLQLLSLNCQHHGAWAAYAAKALYYDGISSAVQVLEEGAAAAAAVEAAGGDVPGLRQDRPDRAAAVVAGFRLARDPAFRCAALQAALEEGEVFDQDIAQGLGERELVLATLNEVSHHVLNGRIRDAQSRLSDAWIRSRSCSRDIGHLVARQRLSLQLLLMRDAGAPAAPTPPAARPQTPPGELDMFAEVEAGAAAAAAAAAAAQQTELEEDGAAASIAAAAQAGRDRREAFHGLLQALQELLERELAPEAALVPIQLPCSEGDAGEEEALLPPPAAWDTTAAIDLVEPLLAQLRPGEVAEVVEVVLSGAMGSTALAAWLVRLAAAPGGGAGRHSAAWSMPPLAAALTAALPPASAAVWYEGVLLAEKQCRLTAKQLCERGRCVHPFSRRLGQKLISLASNAGSAQK